jgi:hypothetical protein
VRRLLLFASLLLPALALAQAPDSRFSAGGYFRVMARPDFQGGSGALGYWNLYGRLMNEGPYAMLEMKLDLLQAAPGSTDVWASVFAKIEGGSVGAADPNNGSLANFRLSQLYANAGNILAPNLTWRLGTQQYYFGDLGLYDARFAQILDDTVGLSAFWHTKKVDVLLAVGDSGYTYRGANYVPFLTGGGAVRVRVVSQFEFGVAGQVAVEPFIPGNKNSSYVTPGVAYEDYLRGEVLQHYLAENPTGFNQFPLPQPASQTSVSWRAVGYLGFGGFGPVRWNNFFARLRRLPPTLSYDETYQGKTVTIYTADLTRDRYQLQIGDELQVKLIPDRLDLAVAGMYGTDRDYANTLQASEGNREYMSVVARFQLSLTRTLQLLLENSLAHERSLNGNLFRTSYDSIFQSTNGASDTRGLQYGDASVRDTWQLKTGVVLNPTGFGIYARPSIRLLYGFQYSTQHAAFGNGFTTSLSQYDAFKPTASIHWHHLVSLETEGWF